MSGASPAELYLEAANSFVAFARKIDGEDWSRPVPCTPEWTARDVLGHVAGVADDLVNGRMEGAPSSAWTAAQVTRHAAAPVDELLAEWESMVDAVLVWITDSGATFPASDCHCHEHDLRHALDLPGNRENIIVSTAAEVLLDRLEIPFPVEVEMDGEVFDNGHEELGRYPHEEVVLRGVSSFEVFRSRLGRRTREQVEELRWSGPPDRIRQVIDQWFALGPSLVAIHE